MPTETAQRAPRGQRRGTGPAPAAAPEAVAETPAAPNRPTPMGKGWGAVQKSTGKSGFATEFNPGKDGKVFILAFLENEPFAAYDRHFFKALPDIDGKHQQLGHPCPRRIGEDCAAHDLLDQKASQQICFNVIDLANPVDEKDEPLVKVWSVGVTVAEQLREFAEDAKEGPLDGADRYWKVKRTVEKQGNRDKWTTHITRLKERDLVEDYPEFSPLDKDARAEYADDLWTEKTYVFYSPERLDRAVASIMGSSEE